MRQYAERGVGLVEVLVALLLLAVGVLGYTALQLRAVDASGEALSKSQATLLLRGVAESMRANADGQGSYPAAMQSYVGYSAATTSPRSCFNQACTSAQMARFDAFLAARSAFGVGIHMTMTGCPGTNGRRQCVYAAWGETTLAATNVAQCMDGSGVYVPGSSCLMMEAY